MESIDWIVLYTTLLFIVVYGTWKTKKNTSVKDYILGNQEAKWWTVGLSVMATQASAITFLSTPGQAFHDGMGFVQFYFGLPLAMIVICMVFIPVYHKLKVYTAYEFLEQRFDLKTRSLTAILFLVQRGLAAGITIYAPSIILSAVLGWDLKTLNIIIGSLVIIYTVIGGTKAVNVTQKQQMFVIMSGMFVAFFLIMNYLPDDLTFNKALKVAGANDKLNILDFSWNTKNRYTFWSGITGGFFLMLSYFGTDQSQVQRYLSGKSIRESQIGLIFNALLKVPMQFFILLVGVMVFVFYQYHASPLNFNPAATEAVLNSPYADDYRQLEQEHSNLETQKKMAQEYYSGVLNVKDYQLTMAAKRKIQSINKQERANRGKARELIEKADASIETNDKDYVFIHFILNNLPRGFIGLLLAVILSAAMSSTASELNALGTITTIDLYKRNHKTEKKDSHYLSASKWFTLLWGCIAILFANFGSLVDNLIQLVNIIGSVFYGNVLGIFLLAFFFRFIRGNAVFWSALITQSIIFFIYYRFIHIEERIGYLWLNFIGCVLVIGISIVIETLFRSMRLNKQ
ncbi:sodium:solute symporter [Sinomicrobium weinanense]|uniref:Sodium:solute symporter n=1 Tax=Sinomicrobium weinanense TaxID=2842200 RepID=A0A926JT07_9FLAO|nr:sodium:solute symporter [Sinomicrobium weinanense]MBC9796982.1 sodium:solute symporter [Sinomicrobium weinanense]MBU3122179.1 sodium:solute symporter [Sinomicrobium weinanense]